MRKKGIALILLLTLTAALGLSACGQEKQDAEKIWYEKIVRIFADGEFIETGDESIPALVGQKDMAVSAEKGRQYFELLDTALRNLPEEERKGPLEKADTMINDKIQFNDVWFEEKASKGGDGETAGTVYVDFKTDDSGAGQLAGGGSLEETLLISQIVESLIHSFEEVDQVQFLINGKEAETLMGHCDVTEPYTQGIYTFQADE